MAWIRRGGLTVAATVAGVMLVGVPAASAATGTVNTSGVALTVRSGAGTGYTATGSVPDGNSVTITCQTRGTTVTGTYGTSSVWDKITSPAGYVADAYVYTGSDGTVAPPCIQTVTDDYPYKSDSWSEADPWLFYKRECVSFAAWRVRQRLGVDFTNSYGGVHWGNAINWDNAASAAGVRVDHTAKVGAVAQWNTGTYGHVAYVARVNSDGTILVEEYNYLSAHNYDTRTISASSVGNFIHF
ncbi:CHAP domain-containing protein [Actinoallomurus soli]|uniref:CHAP domain-containing protein n=1 Tax=Actinoallomurus soli TaxID=2952535 RepID=UPI0020921F82|nr:CHAP domain-containing protein [Actinoallomurus soli]MCO5972694.1 CHAP domain-containing protein [Actinoallomurus soli]